MKKLNYNTINQFYNDNKNIIIPVGILIILLVILFIVVRKSKEKTIRFAKRFLGQEETGDNQGFYSNKLQNLLTKVGWKPGYQWCAFFGKMVWVNTLKNKHRKLAEKLMSGSTQLTLKNFQNDKSGHFKITNKPKKGGLVIWRSKKDASRGHMGIITKAKRNGEFETIEGNSNKGGSPGIVSRNKYKKNGSPKGLKIMAFINPV